MSEGSVRFPASEALPSSSPQSAAVEANMRSLLLTDEGICGDCLRELFDPTDRRYRYPFVHCAHCGPRYTVLTRLPYRREHTTLAAFQPCAACEIEARRQGGRRFQDLTIVCPDCGPQVWLEAPDRRCPTARGDAALRAARRCLAAGRIVACKGMGGFHLICDATNPLAVAELRRRLGRPAEPWVVMGATLDILARCVVLDEVSAERLLSAQRPVVILPRRRRAPVAPEVAPGLSALGVRLPATPLHYLLIEPTPDFPNLVVLVSEEPPVTTNAEARSRLGPVADVLLLHDWDIAAPCGDSVERVVGRKIIPIRRARGQIPRPLPLPQRGVPLLAVGSDPGGTFALTDGRQALSSPPLGNLSRYSAYRAFEATIRRFETLFQLRPRLLVADRHPDYLSTQYARRRAQQEGLPLRLVQHHHAHLAACLADNGYPGDRPVLGVIFDDVGYGDDGALWGGEFLLGDYRTYRRIAHLGYAPLPGGERAQSAPWRTALAYLWAAGLPWDDDLPPVAQTPDKARQGLRHQIEAQVGIAPTSSVSRLFAAFAALVGLCSEVSYPAQAPQRVEALADPHETRAYAIPVHTATLPWQADLRPLWHDVIFDLRKGVPREALAARLHNGLIRLVVEVARKARTAWGCDHVALSGGVWQNGYLFQRTVQRLRDEGFTVLIHRQVPPNDSGLAFGQAAVVLAQSERPHPGL